MSAIVVFLIVQTFVPGELARTKKVPMLTIEDCAMHGMSEMIKPLPEGGRRTVTCDISRTLEEKTL